MRISLNWLKEFVDIQADAAQLADQLTMLGLEVESVIRPWAEIDGVTIGHIRSIEPHPDADKLVVCRTDVGQGEPLQIICGAKNMKVGDRVPTATVGAKLPGGFEISRRKMRGVESCGMMCSPKELGLGEDHSGLLILEPDAPIGADFVTFFGLDDVIFEIEITPNRGDWASMIGIARELAALYKTGYRVPQFDLEESLTAASSLASVTIECPDLCPRYIARVMTDVTVGPSPLWLCRRLIAAGQRPINNVVDITNLVLMETGHPLHAFDYDKLAENRIVVRNARSGEKIVSIDGEKRDLAPEMMVIADAERPVAVAGIMGGEESEVGEGTARVLLESAYFNPVSVRRTARDLGMQTEASVRFQRGADPEMALYAINRSAALMQQLAGVEVCAGALDQYPKPVERNEIQLRYDRTDLLLGVQVEPSRQEEILARLGFDVTEVGERAVKARPPFWRHDCSQEADIIEEVARLINYDTIPASVPTVRLSETKLAPEEDRLRRLRRFLVGLGLTELMNWTFSSPAEVEKSGLPESCMDMVPLKNPLSENQATMRSSLIPGLLRTVARNINHGVPDVSAFELGPIYKPLLDKDLPEQETRLALVMTGCAGGKHWSREAVPVDFYDLKGVAEAVLDFLDAEVQFEPAKRPPFEPDRCGVVRRNGTVLGCLGAICSKVLANYDLSQDVYIFETALQPLLSIAKPPVQFTAPPAFPPSLRDIAVIVDRTVPAGEVQGVAAKAGGKLLRRVDLFDIYTGEQIPPDKKSVALSLVFQSEERTLTDKDTQKAWDRILNALESQFQAKLR